MPSQTSVIHISMYLSFLSLITVVILYLLWCFGSLLSISPTRMFLHKCPTFYFIIVSSKYLIYLLNCLGVHFRYNLWKHFARDLSNCIRRYHANNNYNFLKLQILTNFTAPSLFSLYRITLYFLQMLANYKLISNALYHLKNNLRGRSLLIL